MPAAAPLPGPAPGQLACEDTPGSRAERSARRPEAEPTRGGPRFALSGRVSTEDHQDPVTSRARQLGHQADAGRRVRTDRDGRSARGPGMCQRSTSRRPGTARSRPRRRSADKPLRPHRRRISHRHDSSGVLPKPYRPRRYPGRCQANRVARASWRFVGEMANAASDAHSSPLARRPRLSTEGAAGG